MKQRPQLDFILHPSSFILSLQAGRCSAGPHEAGVSVRVRGLQLLEGSRIWLPGPVC